MKTIKTQIAVKLMTKFLEYNIDVNAKQKYNCNSMAFHLACLDGNTEIVRIMINMADTTNLDLEAKCLRTTGLQFAMSRDYHEIVDIIISRKDQ